MKEEIDYLMTSYESEVYQGEGDECEFSSLSGKTLNDMSIFQDKDGDDFIVFITDGGKYIMLYEHDCCATCNLQRPIDDFSSIIGYKILLAEEKKIKNDTEYGHETSVFYKIQSEKDHFSFAWRGESNGYYSEEATLFKLEKGDINNE